MTPPLPLGHPFVQSYDKTRCAWCLRVDQVGRCVDRCNRTRAEHEGTMSDEIKRDFEREWADRYASPRNPPEGIEDVRLGHVKGVAAILYRAGREHKGDAAMFIDAERAWESLKVRRYRMTPRSAFIEGYRIGRQHNAGGGSTPIHSCRFCGAPAVVRVALPHGCFVYPDDREQDLCPQHAEKCDARGVRVIEEYA